MKPYRIAYLISCLTLELGICGCSWLNGDPLWLWSGQKSVTVRKRVSTLFDTQYDLKAGNMPFTFVADGGDVELGLFGHVRGCPDPDDRISKDAVVVFEIADGGYGATVFSISNGVLRLERKGEGFKKAYVANSYESNRPELPLDDLEKGVDVVDCLLSFHCVKDWVFSMLGSSAVEYMPVGREVSAEYAQVSRQLQERGAPIPQNDIWIAATALVRHAPLCTLDDHFKNVESLELVAL